MTTEIKIKVTIPQQGDGDDLQEIKDMIKYAVQEAISEAYLFSFEIELEYSES